ncbi:MAG: hypothetical protein PG980_000524 [Wolbachia endosymbiont of Ctenocephalides felis wCfeJ]|nr:MAG: hypothetical protein PG980_000524 [Wolbachia endosymbiont of Ctenocephalides felis wCfeJ]
MNIRNLLFSILYKNENKAYLFAWINIRNLLFSILCKNENKTLSICMDENKKPLVFDSVQKWKLGSILFFH